MAGPSVYCLPNELIGDVVKHAGATPGNISNICRASRLLYHLGQREMYRHIIIRQRTNVARLVKTLIENPALQGFIKSVDLDPIPLEGFYYPIVFDDWRNTTFDQSKLSQMDRFLLLLTKSHCRSKKVEDTFFSVLALLLHLVNQAEEVTLGPGIFCQDSNRAVAAGLQALWPSITDKGAIHGILFPALKKLHFSTRNMSARADFFYSGPFHPICPLIASANLTELSVSDEINAWHVLDNLSPNQHLSVQKLHLLQSQADSYGLAKLLKRCPDLESLQLDSKYPRRSWANAGPQECINEILPEACPRLHELSLRFRGSADHFFPQSSLPQSPNVLNCLGRMNSLKELRIEIDCFFRTPSDIQQLGSTIGQLLPVQLEKFFLETTSALAGVNGRITAQHPQVLTYKQGIENLLYALCKARIVKLVHLNTVIIGARFGKPRQWTRKAKYCLPPGPTFKFVSGKTAANLWDCTWDEMLDA